MDEAASSQMKGASQPELENSLSELQGSVPVNEEVAMKDLEQLQKEAVSRQALKKAKDANRRIEKVETELAGMRSELKNISAVLERFAPAAPPPSGAAAASPLPGNAAPPAPLVGDAAAVAPTGSHEEGEALDPMDVEDAGAGVAAVPGVGAPGAPVDLREAKEQLRTMDVSSTTVISTGFALVLVDVTMEHAESYTREVKALVGNSELATPKQLFTRVFQALFRTLGAPVFVIVASDMALDAFNAAPDSAAINNNAGAITALRTLKFVTTDAPCAAEPAIAMVARLIMEKLAESRDADGFLQIMFAVTLSVARDRPAGGAAGGTAVAAAGAGAGGSGAAAAAAAAAEARRISLQRFEIVNSVATAEIAAAQGNDVFADYTLENFEARLKRKCKEGLNQQGLSGKLTEPELAEVVRLIREMVRGGSIVASSFKERAGPEAAAAAGYSPKGKQLGVNQQPLKGGRGRGFGRGGRGGDSGGRGGRGGRGGHGGGGGAGAGAAPVKAQ